MSATGGREGPHDGLQGGHRLRKAILTISIVALALLNVAWTLLAANLAHTQQTRKSYQTQVLADIRYYDELLTMSARMVALGGSQVWIDRYRAGEVALSQSIQQVRNTAPADEIVGVVAASEANEQLLQMEHRALDAAAAGDLGTAQAILDSPRYTHLKAEYAAAQQQAAAQFQLSSLSDRRTQRLLLGLQLAITLLSVAVIALLGYWMVRAMRMASSEAIARRDAELRRSTELLDRAIAEAAVGVALLSPDGRITTANRALCTFLGRDASVLVGSRWSSVADRPETADALVGQALAARDEPVRGTQTFRHPSGATLTGAVAITTILDADGMVRALAMQVTDLTERTRVAEELAESERRFRLLAEFATDVIFTVDGDLRITWISSSVTEVLGWEPDELIGRHSLEFNHPDDVPALAARWQHPPRQNPLPVVRFATKDGQWRWMSVSGRLMRTHEPAFGARVALRDVTAEVEAKAALQSSEHRFRVLAENATDFIFQTDADGVVIWVAPTVSTALGWTPEDLIGRHAGEVLGMDHLANGLVHLPTKDGIRRWQTSKVTALSGGDGFVVAMQDIDDLVRAREESQGALAREESTRMSMDSAAIGMALTTTEGRFAYVNPALAEMLGYTPDDLVGAAFKDLTHPDDAQSGVQALHDLGAGRIDRFAQRKRYRTRDGRTVWVDLTVVAVPGSDGRPTHYVAQMVNVTAEVETFQELQRGLRRYRMLAENASDVVLETNLDGVITWVSPSVRTALGVEPESLHGRPAAALVDAGDEAAIADLVVRAVGGEISPTAILRCHPTDGRTLFVSVEARSIQDPDTGAGSCVLALRDVSEEVSIQRELDHRARTDDLTGLLNRVEILDRLDKLIHDRRGNGQRVAVAFVDIDRLKAINDRYGHAAGDLLITTVGRRIQRSLRTSDLVARFGGDELLVVLLGVSDPQTARTVGEKMRASVAHPLQLGDRMVVPTVSIGIALVDPALSTDETIARADNAMYEAKSRGRDAVVIAVPSGSA